MPCDDKNEENNENNINKGEDKEDKKDEEEEEQKEKVSMQHQQHQHQQKIVSNEDSPISPSSSLPIGIPESEKSRMIAETTTTTSKNDELSGNKMKEEVKRPFYVRNRLKISEREGEDGDGNGVVGSENKERDPFLTASKDWDIFFTNHSVIPLPVVSIRGEYASGTGFLRELFNRNCPTVLFQSDNRNHRFDADSLYGMFDCLIVDCLFACLLVCLFACWLVGFLLIYFSLHHLLYLFIFSIQYLFIYSSIHSSFTHLFNYSSLSLSLRMETWNSWRA
jgi:hypothetical protein